MTRTVYPGGWYADATPAGSFVVLFPGSHLLTHLGRVELPPGEPWGVGYVRCTDVGGFSFAGQAHTTLNPACWSWYAGVGWVPLAPPCVGVSPVIYGLDGVLHRSDGSVGSQGYRYVAPDGTLVSGDATYGPFHGLSEYSAAGDLWIGQGHDAGGVLVWDGAVLRLLETGDGRFVRVQVDGERVSIAWMASIGAVVILTTLAELRALPPVDAPEPPEPTPEPPDPPQPLPEPPKPVPVPPQPPVLPYGHHSKGHTMEIDGKTVLLRGPAGLLGYPAALNTGPWGGLGAGWRGFAWAGAHDTGNDVTHHRAAKLPNGRYTFTSASNGLAGADATKHSGSIGEQFYYKPDGNTDAGDYEQWRVYDGNENGALEAQIEYRNDEGAYFSCPLAVEVVG